MMRSFQLATLGLGVASLLLPVAAETSFHNSQDQKGLRPSFVSLVQQGAHHHKHHKHHKHHLRQHHHKEVSQQDVQAPAADAAPAASTAPATYAAIASTVKDISKQIAESSVKWEEANKRCCEQRALADGALETLDEGIAQANGGASSATGEILKANKLIAANENKIPQEKDSMASLREGCKNDKVSMDKDLAITFTNLDGLDAMPMTDCDSGAAALLQCEHPNGESFLMLDHHTMRKTSAEWQAPAVQRLLKDFSSSDKSKARPVVFMQFAEHANPHKCSMQANPECQQIRDRYLLMTSDLEDNIDEISDKLKEGENGCEANVKQIEENIKNANGQLKLQQTALAEATADYNTAMEASRLKNEERAAHVATMKEQTKKCMDEKAELLGEKAGLLKIRGEMITMKKLDNIFIQDCKVSDWTPGECSKPCGGGIRFMTRDVLVPKQLDGAECGFLKAQETCNTQKCPTNCEMGEWGGWSACSAKCGGGVFERVRPIKRQAAHGGKPCTSSGETQSCNAQSCDANCKLSGWSHWTACSKACDGGTTLKERHVKKAAEGQGTCPGKFHRKRFRAKSCNPKACLSAKDKDKSLKCASKRDVVILIDGSASLRTSGWDATKKAATQIVQAMDKEVDVSVILFSGPKSRKNYFKCSGQKWPNRKTGVLLGAPDMEKDCMVSFVTHFENNKDKVVAKIAAMKWPRGSTLTSEGLAMAETELDGGRRDAQAVVVVVTDGKPMNKRKVDMTVERLRKKARLMWVAVSQNAPVDLIKKWASVPAKENVVLASNFKELVSKKITNKLISNMCPTMEVV